jgi:FMN phosphatase YigB (HAD superfamily)
MVASGEIVFLLDVDNTLLDNDRFAADLGAQLEHKFGAAERERYWNIFAELRERVGVADYLASLQTFRTGIDDDPALLQMSSFLLEYPFARLVYARAAAAIEHLHTMGLPVVLSDGDVVFQPRKIQRSGIWDAVQGRVMIYVHKERVLDHVQRRYPAAHYVMVDDKPNLLAAMKIALGAKLTTVFVRQGHYAHAEGADAVAPRPDRAIGAIGDLMNLQLHDFQEPA